jgi:hypothetical protein
MPQPKQRTNPSGVEDAAAASEPRRPRRRSRRRRSRRSSAPEKAAPGPTLAEVPATAIPATEPDEVTVEATRIEEDAATAHHQVEEQTRRHVRPSKVLLDLVGERLAGTEGIIIFRRPETSPCSRFLLKECFE